MASPCCVFALCAGMLESFSSSVVEIIDHHEKSNHSVADLAGVSTTIEMVGSCATLIARELLNDDSFTMEEQVAILLLSSILLDTGNLKAARRVTQTDETVVEELKNFLPSSINCDDHFSKLLKARFDISNLSSKQVLQKDYKECVINNYTIGFCSVSALLSGFLSRTNINNDMREFHSDHKLDALVLLGISKLDPSDTKMQRQVAVFQPEGVDSDFSESILNVLEANEELQCKRVDQNLEFTGVLLEQENVDMSRKHIIPIVSSFVRSV